MSGKDQPVSPDPGERESRSDDRQMHCPACGEDAVRQPPADLVPWEALDAARPGWSHRDGSSLCPVIGPSGGYEPAHPQPRLAGADSRTARLEPPGDTRPSMRTEIARQLADREEQAASERPAGTAGVIGRRHMAQAIARLGDPRRQAATTTQPEYEPEAGG